MKTLNLIRSAAITLLLFATTSASADEPAKLSPADREAVLAKLKTNKVSLQGLTIVSKKGSPAINLGTGLDGGEANNANDENLRLIAQLPEVEQVMIYKGKITADGLAALAALPKLRYLQMYATEVPAAAFSVLPKLTQLKSLSLSNYIVTDEVISYAGQIKGLKSFDQSQSAMTPAGFLKFLNSVESLEQLTLFGDYVDDACMKRIGEMKDLKRFWTNSKRITSAGWVHLAGLAKMEDLFVSETNFGDEDARALEGMKDLKNLGLNKTKITDTGMPSLAGLTKLHDFGLEGTKVTDKGMVILKGMMELDNIYVGMTEVTAKGLALVPRKDRMVMMRVGKAALSAKQIDEMMTMYPGTQIFDPSGYWKPERVKAAMKELGKPWPPMPKDKDKPTQPKPEEKQEEQTAAIKALQKNGVDTNGITFSTDDLGGPFINLGGNKSSRATANDENLALVAQLPQLKRIVITRGNFTNVGLSKLNALTNLRNLLILDPDLNSGVINALAELKIPYYLTFDKCEITDEILGRLANNPKLLKGLFIVTAPKLTPAAVAKFLDTVDDLEELSIGYLKNVIDDGGMKHLAKMKSLKRLWVESQKITKAVDESGQKLQQDTTILRNVILAPSLTEPNWIIARPIQALVQEGFSKRVVDSKVPIHFLKAQKESKSIQMLEGKLILQVFDDSKPILEITNIEKEVGKKIEGKSGAWIKINECKKNTKGSHSLRIEYDIPADADPANAQNDWVQFGGNNWVKNGVAVANGMFLDMVCGVDLGGFIVFDVEGKALTPESSSSSIRLGPGGPKGSRNVTYPANSKPPFKIVYEGGTPTTVEVPFSLKLVPLH